MQYRMRIIQVCMYVLLLINESRIRHQEQHAYYAVRTFVLLDVQVVRCKLLSYFYYERSILLVMDLTLYMMKIVVFLFCQNVYD